MLTSKLYFEPDSISVGVPWVNIIVVSYKPTYLCLAKILIYSYSRDSEKCNVLRHKTTHKKGRMWDE